MTSTSGGDGFQAIVMLLPTRVEVELGCENILGEMGGALKLVGTSGQSAS
jgi:hypothetical protein